MSAPNILLLVVDSLRADAIFGDHIATPNISALGERGAAFRQCVATATSTTPSFSSLLTGCYPPRHGVRGLQGYRLIEALPTMAEVLSRAGYATHAEVTGPLVPETGILRGFDDARHRAGYRAPFMGWRDDVVRRMSDLVGPWFLLLHVWEVHRPYRAPPDFTKRWDRAGYERAVAAVDEWLVPVLEAAGDALVVVTGDHGEDYPESRWEQRLIRLGRRARTRLKPARWFPYLDDRLQSLAIGHGFALHEQLVRVPLVIAGPGVSSVTVDAQVRHVDLLPTLADLVGAPAPPDLDGRSLRPLIEGSHLPEEPAYMEAVGVKLEGRRIEGVRTAEWKLLRVGGGRPRLFRLDGGAPPDERRDVYERHRDVAADLESYLERVASQEVVAASGMSQEEEAVVEQHLRDLGYL